LPQPKYDYLWTVRAFEFGNNALEVYVNHLPKFRRDELNRLFGGGSEQFRPLSIVAPQLRREVSQLGAEVAALLPVGGSPADDEGPETSVRLHALSHYARFGEYPPDLLECARKIYVGGNDINDTEKPHPRVPIATLSSSARRTIGRLDRFADEHAFRVQYEVLRLAYEQGRVPELPVRKISVFISYRQPAAEYARRLHELLMAYGGGAYFRPYLDEESVRSGPLLEQLFLEIQQADLFVPLVTADYAAEGSISSRELSKADEVAAKRRSDNCIVPVFVGAPESTVAAQLGSLVRRTVQEPQDLGLKGALGQNLCELLRRSATGTWPRE
jgi:hypothetical protein